MYMTMPFHQHQWRMEHMLEHVRMGGKYETRQRKYKNRVGMGGSYTGRGVRYEALAQYPVPFPRQHLLAWIH